MTATEFAPEIDSKAPNFGLLAALVLWGLVATAVATSLWVNGDQQPVSMMLMAGLSVIASLWFHARPNATGTQILMSLAITGNVVVWSQANFGTAWSEPARIGMILALTFCAGWRKWQPLVAVALLIAAVVVLAEDALQLRAFPSEREL